MGDVGELYRVMKQEPKKKKATNRDLSPQMLEEKGIPFEVKNNDIHLIVEGNTHYIDFWPGTGKWKCRSGKDGFGIRKLIEYVIGASDD